MGSSTTLSDLMSSIARQLIPKGPPRVLGINPAPSVIAASLRISVINAIRSVEAVMAGAAVFFFSATSATAASSFFKAAASLFSC